MGGGVGGCVRRGVWSGVYNLRPPEYYTLTVCHHNVT